MNKDEYGEIINGEETYKEIAYNLKIGENVIIGWTDEKMTHLDVLFTLRACKKTYNYLQRGLNGSELFISIIGKGAFGFNFDNKKSSDYIAEKLNLTGQPTIDKFGELINGVIEQFGVIK